MAKHFLRGESVPVILPDNLINAAALLAQVNRDQIAQTIELLVAFLDVTDADPEAEVTRAEDDFVTLPPGIDYGPGCALSDAGGGNDAEDDHCLSPAAMESALRGAGCAVADPGGCEHDGREPAYHDEA